MTKIQCLTDIIKLVIIPNSSFRFHDCISIRVLLSKIPMSLLLGIKMNWVAIGNAECYRASLPKLDWAKTVLLLA